MKQIGNLAAVCAQRKDLTLRVGRGGVCVTIFRYPLAFMTAKWDDDDAILHIIHELNFGEYREVRHSGE